MLVVHLNIALNQAKLKYQTKPKHSSITQLCNMHSTVAKAKCCLGDLFCPQFNLLLIYTEISLICNWAGLEVYTKPNQTKPNQLNQTKPNQTKPKCIQQLPKARCCLINAGGGCLLPPIQSSCNFHRDKFDMQLYYTKPNKKIAPSQSPTSTQKTCI